MKKLKAKSFNDWSKGCYIDTSETLAPENSAKLNLNLDSDFIIGELVSRLGSTIIGTQIIDNKPILGLHNFIDSGSGTGSKLFAVVSDGTNNDIYDVLTGAKSLQDDTKDLKTRFITYLDSCLRLNGTDLPKAWNGTSWVSASSGAFTNALTSLSTGTFTAATTDIITSNSHGLSEGDMVILTTTGTLPAELALSTVYYVDVLSDNTFSLYVDSSLAQIVDITNTGTGTHTWTKYTTTLTDVAHGLSNGNIVKLTTTSSLPLGMSINTSYYVINKTDDTFQLSATSGGTALNIGNVGAGTNTWQLWDAFDLSNIPTTAKYAIEFKDRIYLAGRSDYPDRVDISGIADSTSRTISWTKGNKFILFEQEDGGGGITGLAKVPGYVLVFKRRTLKRYDGASAFPEDMINQGSPSQEAIVVAQGICFFVNENGAWATEGGRPKKISSFSVDSVIKSISATNLQNVASGTDEEHIYWSFSSVTVNGETYSNIVLKYNILQNTWDIRKYPTLHRIYTKYVDTTGAVFTIFGDDDGNVCKLNVGYTDNGTPISWALETQDITFGFRIYLKSILGIGFITENISKASVMWRNVENQNAWMPLGTIDKEEKMFDKVPLNGVKFNFKIMESISTGRSKIKSIEIPIGTTVYDTTI